MQNVTNFLCPFLLEGEPIVNGRVYFVKASTSAQTFDQVTALDNADFINIYDKNNTRLENPLPLNSEGTWDYAHGKQPFVDDDIDYKMIVCRPTGIDADLNDETPAWEVAYTIVSKAGKISVTYAGIGTVDDLAELRLLDPNVGTVLVLGYGSKNDFCPPRVFKWVNYYSTDNGGTKIRSSVEGWENRGMWLCDASNYVDLRWFGVDPSQDVDYTAQIIAVAQAYTTIPIYFPKGDYKLSANVSLNSAIVDRLAIFTPGINSNIAFTVDNAFVNRGGRFDANAEDYIVYPKVKGTLYTSWLSSPVNAAFSAAALAKVDLVVFDAAVEASAVTTISNKRVVVRNGVSIDNTLNFDSSCVVIYEENGKVSLGSVDIGEDWSVVPTPNSVTTGKVLDLRFNGRNVMQFTGADIARINFFLKALSGLSVDENMANGWGHFETGDEWEDYIQLIAEKARITSAKITALSLVFGHANTFNAGFIKSENIRYGDTYIVYVVDDQIRYGADGSVISSFSNNVLDVQTKLIDHFADEGAHDLNAVINVVICGDYNQNFYLYFPSAYKNAKILIHNHTARNVGCFLENGTTAIKVMGKEVPMSSNERVLVRNLTPDEQTRFNVNDYWVIDPFTA